MLVLQGLFGAFATGAADAGEMLDAFGNPLCITSMDGGSQTPDSRDHSAMPDCCTAACGMFAPLAAENPSPHSLSNPLSPSATVEPTTGLAVFHPAPGHDPGSPRAPPVTA